MKKAKSILKKNEPNKILPVVGIGVSAGGLDALKKFFVAIPSDTGVAFVVIQHLDPNHNSLLADLVSRFTEMKVSQIVDGVEIIANTIFIIPPGFDVSLENNKLMLAAQPRPRTLRLPIDSFFKTLAHDKKDGAIGIILSGTGTDGTMGVRDIKSENGIVFVQTPEDAKYDGMPVSAISTGVVDYILDADKMSEHLLACIKYIFEVSDKISLPEKLSTNITNNLFGLLNSKTGHDFSNYKPNTIKRRIERRMKITQVAEIEDYIAILQKDPDELEALFKDFLIGVTGFFRDKEAFDSLNSKIIPEIFSQNKKDIPIRIWIPACSTGEEAFSVAILFEEFKDKHELNAYSVQIFATDIDKYAIEKARQAVYPESIAHDIPEQYLRKYFTHENNVYVVNKRLRDIILFAEQSVSKDPPFSKVDLISCRNLLIYLSNELQEKIISSFYYALKLKGYLFLGTSETLGKNRDLFSTKDEKWKLYQKNSVTPNSKYIGILPSFSSNKRGNLPLELPIEKGKRMTLKNIVENKILKNFTPASVLVNNKKDIVYLKGNTSAYLEPVEGIANMNLIEMAKPDIRIRLGIALGKAIKENKKVIEEKLHIKTNNTYKFITIQILPIEDKNQESNLFLVVFEDITEKEIFLEKDTQFSSEKDKDYIKNLELELNQTKEQLRSVIEDSETKNEELKATNEELQSSNEELQTTNEELETSKEELQSINEELITLNNEHQNKIGELWDKNNDISNLLKNTEIATIFLDLDLKIKMFTPRVQDFINLMATDIGRFIENFSIKLNYPEFLNDVKQVLNTLDTVEKEVEGIGKFYICRIMPYRTLENVVTGVVITLVEVTNLKNAEQKVQEYKNLLEKNGSIAKLGVWDLDLKTDEIIWSNETYKIFELTRDYKPSVETDIKFYHPDYQQKLLQLVENAIANGEPYSIDLILITAKGNEIWVRAIGEAIVENGETVKISGTLQNINAEKLALEALKQSENKYRQLFQYFPNSVIIHDLEMNIIDVNDQAITEFGYSRDEFSHKNVFELHPKNELSNSEKVLDKVKKNKSLIVETKFLRKDGTTFIAEATPSKFLLKDQEVVQVVIRNITEIKEAEKQIIQAKEKAEENERLYRLLIDSIPETSIHLVNKDFRYLTLGGTELDKNNFDKSKILGQTLQEAFPKAIADKFEPSFQKAFKGEIIDFEMDYEEFIYQQQFLPVKNAKGNIFAAMQIATNITERKKAELALLESEKKYKAIFYNVQAAILVADDKGKYLSVNDAACNLFGYTKDEFLQMKAGDLQVTNGVSVESRYQEYIKKGSESGEFEFLTKNNEVRTCQYIAVRPYADFNISILMDITDLKKNQQKLRESESHLKELNDTKDKFFSIIAHDLKSPFNSIIGLTEILNEEASNYSAKQIQELAELIYSSSTLAFKLLNNLLQWSRLQTGAIKPDFTKVKPADVIAEVKLLMESSANSKNIQLKSEININDAIWADLEMVKTILRNLISNALKFTNPKGKVIIETQNSGDYILFIVSDTGVGIKADQMGNLFKINNKLSRIGTAKEKGTGLGLILCAEFIKLQGGQIWAESQLDVGSKFYFTLPKKGK